jgi:hypothetical protein
MANHMGRQNPSSPTRMLLLPCPGVLWASSKEHILSIIFVFSLKMQMFTPGAFFVPDNHVFFHNFFRVGKLFF